MVESIINLSIIVPAFNEEQFIPNTLQSLLIHLNRLARRYEIIVVDDGSTDSTRDLVCKQVDQAEGNGKIRILINEKNHGKGYSIKRGMLAAEGVIRIFIDADLPFELDAVDRIIEKIETGDEVVIGARDLPGSTLVGVPFMRFLAGQVFSLLVHIFVNSGIHETQCGIKGFSARAAKTIFSRATITGFGADVELLYISRKLDYRISRIAVKMTGFREKSRVRLFKDSLKMFLDLFVIRWNDLRGQYR
jgi:dolichyl-phosphate beta-glucosyltransferase